MEYVLSFFAPLRLCVRTAYCPIPNGKRSSRSAVARFASNPKIPKSQNPKIPNPLRRAITLIEVLISIAILSIGVLGVAALLPIGKLSLMKTEIADRTGACGRAAMREVKVRRMLDPNLWAPSPGNTNVFFIDPLGLVNNPTNTTLAGMSRINLQTYPGSGTTLGSTTTPTAQSIFTWQDELTYAMPKDMTSGSAPTNGTRPMPVVVSNTQQVDGKFSWFLTVSPSAVEPISQRQTYNVAAVVCNRRDFSSAGETVLSGGSCDNAIGYGGIGFTTTGSAGTTTLKNNDWALLYNTSGTQYTWYRAVGIGYDTSISQTRMTLVGPDWYGGTNASLLVIPGVTGVYTATVKLDNDEIWSK
jgi:prepilin-type N-terminal cleavage/methylation domain-containing protein